VRHVVVERLPAHGTAAVSKSLGFVEEVALLALGGDLNVEVVEVETLRAWSPPTVDLVAFDAVHLLGLVSARRVTGWSINRVIDLAVECDTDEVGNRPQAWVISPTTERM
jgi:hypothetical protein